MRHAVSPLLSIALFAVIVGAVMVVPGCADRAEPDVDASAYAFNPVGPRFDIALDGKPIAAELAVTRQARQRGLMRRPDVPEGTGMLFVFPKPAILSFWMKDTPTPLSIAFIDAEGRVFQIENLQPLSQASVQSRERALYALEVPQNYFQQIAIGSGARLTLSENARAYIGQHLEGRGDAPF